MVIISLFNVFLSILVSNLLFSLVGATINKDKSKFLMLVLSVFSGAVFSTLKLFMIPKIGLVIIALALYGCSSVVLFYPQKMSSFIILEVVTMAYILIGSGVSYLVQLLFFNLFEMMFITYLIYNLVSNILLFFMGGAIFYLFKINYRKKEIIDFVYDVIIELAGRRIKLKMFLDSGNMLYDDKTGLPILVVNKNVFEKKLGYMVVEGACRRVEYTTIDGANKTISVLKPDNIYIVKCGKSNAVRAMIGVVQRNFKIYDGLLHASIL